MTSRSILAAVCGAMATVLPAAGQDMRPAAPPPAKEIEKPVHAEIGEPAPAFTLEDLAGVEHALADYEGRIVVLEWFNPDCPYCRGLYERGVVTGTLASLRALDEDVVYLAVNSTAQGRRGVIPRKRVVERCTEYLEELQEDDRGVDIAVLIDHSGDVGRLYGARTTPHCYVIDREGILRYEGAYTDDMRFEKGDEAINYVVNAVQQIVEDAEAVTPDHVRPWGCSVKYRRRE